MAVAKKIDRELLKAVEVILDRYPAGTVIEIITPDSPAEIGKEVSKYAYLTTSLELRKQWEAQDQLEND